MPDNESQKPQETEKPFAKKAPTPPSDMDKSAAVPEEADKPVKEDAPGATEASSPASASVTEAEKPAPDTQPTEDHKPDTPTSDEISRPDPAAIVDQAEKPALVAKAPPPLEEVAPPAKTEPKTVSPATPKQSTTTTAQPEPAKPASDDTDKETLASKKVVLIVEDTIELAEVLQAKLETMGVTTIHESHANKALEVFKEKRPELVLLDIGLPDMSGWKLLDGIKEFDKENRPRFIIITAYGNPANRLMGKLQDVDSYLIKPFSPDEIERVVGKVLGIEKK